MCVCARVSVSVSLSVCLCVCVCLFVFVCSCVYLSHAKPLWLICDPYFELEPVVPQATVKHGLELSLPAMWGAPAAPLRTKWLFP